VANFFRIAAISGLFTVMVTFTVGLFFVSLSSFGDGGGAQGLFLLLVMDFHNHHFSPLQLVAAIDSEHPRHIV
jgi:hypothetical protein